MTFGEFKRNGGSYDYLVFANDAGSFGHAGDTIYGKSPAMEDWEVGSISVKTNERLENPKVTVALVFPFGQEK